MWQVIIVAVVPCVLGAAIRPLEPFEDPFWAKKMAGALLPNDDLLSDSSDVYSERYRYDSANSDHQDDLETFLPSTDKRALAMFARWNTLSNVGKNRTPIRSSLFDPDSITTQTRGRMPGQPLRWG